jgi:uncharacterized protein YndB with AHSA1/START domain
MNAEDSNIITIEAEINATVEQVWELYTQPEHIVKWNQASDDWHTTKAENDLVTGGSFSSRMEAKDGSFGFEFWGTYTAIELHKLIAYTLGDGRKVSVIFEANGHQTKITSEFEAEQTNSVEMQQAGWQAILNNFKKYVENTMIAS